MPRAKKASSAPKSKLWERPELHDRLKDIQKRPAGIKKRQEAVQELLWELRVFEDRALVLPALSDVIQGDGFPDLRALLEPGLVRKAVERKRLEAAARASFPAALEAWRHSLGIELYDWLAAHIPERYTAQSDEAKLQHLYLATTQFFCAESTRGNCDDDSDTWYDKRMRYPYVLKHVCQTAWFHTELDAGEHWTPGGLSPDDEHGDVVAGLVRASGLDPATASRDDMDALDPRLICRACLEKNFVDADCVSSWWNCIAHYHDAHAGTNSNPLMPLPEELRNPPGRRVEWARLNPAAEAKARELQPRITQAERTKWRCESCPTVVCDTWADAVQHALKAHDLQSDDVVRGEHFLPRDNFVETKETETVYMWELRKAGLTEFFENANLDKVYFDKLVKQFGKVPTRYPNRTGENCWYNLTNYPKPFVDLLKAVGGAPL